jgi:tetratricopeptide (TPR) repeat protein
VSDVLTLDIFEQVKRLADSGDSYRALGLLDTLADDPRVEAQTLRSRVIRHLGNDSRAKAIEFQVWRRQPNHPEAMVVYLRGLSERRGLYRAWQWGESARFPEDAPAESAADWHALRASIAVALRDFDSAARLFARARSLVPDDPWIRVEECHGLAGQDRCDEAIEAAREALSLDADYRAAVQALAHFLSLQRRDDEAIDLLARASARMHSADIEMQLAVLLTEQCRFDEAWRALRRAHEFSPLADRQRRRWLEQQSVSNLLARGRFEEAAPLCVKLGDPFHLGIAERLESVAQHAAASPRRVLLNVAFVHQHHMTCTPATLAALSHYWGREAEHVEIAEQICYNGTPTSSERAWAERNGFTAREFTVDWEVATRLVDAGLPFALTTRYTNFGHTQAVVGYDEVRRTLLIRDPTQRVHTEFSAKELFESLRANGPRGMVLFPPEQAHRLGGIALPDVDQWDRHYAVLAALDRHDRETAHEVALSQQESAPDHWLTIWSWRSLAHYDGDGAKAAALAERLIEQFGERPELLWERHQAMGQVATHPQLRDASEHAARLHPKDAALLAQLASVYLDDARELHRAAANLSLALRVNPVDARNWRAMADVLWLSGERGAALEHYRIATCLGDMAEEMAGAYSSACRMLGQAETGITWLRARDARLGGKSSAPAITCFNELELLERTPEAFELIEKARLRRPDDDALLLFCAQKYLQYGVLDKAQAVLGESAGRVRHADRLRVEALFARYEGRLDDAWLAIARACEQEPARVDLQTLAANILSQREGQPAALDYLRNVCANHRTLFGMHALLLQWLPADALQEREAVLRHLLSLNERNAYMWRELADNLCRQNRLPEAWEAANRSLVQAPQDAATYSVLASLHFAANEVEPGRARCREALRCSIDQAYAFHMLVRTCTSHEERRGALEFIEAQLGEQVVRGDALLMFQRLAKFSYAPEELESRLRALRDRRPELWQAWLGLALQYVDTGKLDEGRQSIDEAIERFSLTPRLHYERARIAAIQGRSADALDAVRRTLQLSPAWSLAIQLYVDLALSDPTQLESALALLDSPLSRSDESADCQVLRAKVLWQMNERERALATLEHALLQWPAHAQAWALQGAYANAQREAGRIRSLAQQVIERHPYNIESRIRLAETSASLADALSELNRAAQMEPLNQTLYVARLDVLLRHRQFDAALEAVGDAPWGEHTPTAVRRYGPRALWQSGKGAEAIAAMRALLERERADPSLWQELVDWLDATEQLDDYLAAASELVRLAPGLAIAHGHLGHAHRKKAEPELAIASLRTALQLDPHYAFAAFALTDLLLDTNWREAQPVLQALRARFPGPAAALREIRYAVAAGDLSTIEAPLAEIVRAPIEQSAIFDEAAKRLKKGDGKRLLLDAIRQAFEAGRAGEPAIFHWIDKEVDLANREETDKLQRYMDGAADAGDHFKIAMIRCAAQQRRGALAATIVDRHSAALRANLRGWGQASYALVACGQYATAVEWLHDWRRDDAPSWALDNLSLAMRELGMLEAAHEVTLASHAKMPTGPNALVFLAIDAALADDVEGMRNYMAQWPSAELRPVYRVSRDLVLAYRQAIDEGRTGPLRKAFALARAQAKTDKLLIAQMKGLRDRWAQRAAGLGRIWRLLSLK